MSEGNLTGQAQGRCTMSHPVPISARDGGTTAGYLQCVLPELHEESHKYIDYLGDPHRWPLSVRDVQLRKIVDLEARLSQALEENERLKPLVEGFKTTTAHLLAMNADALEALRVAEDAAADLRDQNILWNEWMAEIQEKLRVAEAKAALADEVFAMVGGEKFYRSRAHSPHLPDTWPSLPLNMGAWSDWCARYDALTPAADTAEGGKG